MAEKPYANLLEYNPQHGILICTQCKYAIQPNAISRHLKDLHHIYRGQRKELTDSTAHLALSDPADIALPPQHSQPVKGLPVEDGLACNQASCGHLCITTKRMKRHWVTKHDQTGVEGVDWRPVAIQTFFRGAHLRYFIVNPNCHETSTQQASDGPAAHSNTSNTSHADENTITRSSVNPEINSSLLDHYMTKTYKTLVQREEGEELWRTSIFELAQEHLFVMHALLAISALHLAWLDPSQRSQNIVLASLHQQEALPLYQAAVGRPDEHNCHALFAFASILAMLEFASPQDQDGLLFLESTDERDGLPMWLNLIRGGCSLLWSLWSNISTGSMKKLIGMETIEDSLASFAGISDEDPHLAALLPLFLLGSSPLTDADPAELDIYVAALDALRWVFALPYINAWSFTYRYLIQVWPIRVPQEFFRLLNKQRQGALVLLAYYCVLLKRAQSAWYLQQRAEQLMGFVQVNLDRHLADWVQWPRKELEFLDVAEEAFLMENEDRHVSEQSNLFPQPST